MAASAEAAQKVESLGAGGDLSRTLQGAWRVVSSSGADAAWVVKPEGSGAGRRWFVHCSCGGKHKLIGRILRCKNLSMTLRLVKIYDGLLTWKKAGGGHVFWERPLDWDGVAAQVSSEGESKEAVHSAEEKVSATHKVSADSTDFYGLPLVPPPQLASPEKQIHDLIEDFPPIPHAEKFSCCCWINRKGTLRGPSYANSVLSHHGSGTGWELRVNQQNLEFVFTTSGSGHNELAGAFPGHNLRKNVWTHIAATADVSEKKIRIYINGKLANYRTYHGSIVPCKHDLRVLQNPGWTDRTFNGHVVGIRVWRGFTLRDEHFSVIRSLVDSEDCTGEYPPKKIPPVDMEPILAELRDVSTDAGMKSCLERMLATLASDSEMVNWLSRGDLCLAVKEKRTKLGANFQRETAKVFGAVLKAYRPQ